MKNPYKLMKSSMPQQFKNGKTPSGKSTKQDASSQAIGMKSGGKVKAAKKDKC